MVDKNIEQAKMNYAKLLSSATRNMKESITAWNDWGKTMLLIEKHIAPRVVESMKKKAVEDEKNFIENASTKDGTSWKNPK